MSIAANLSRPVLISKKKKKIISLNENSTSINSREIYQFFVTSGNPILTYTKFERDVMWGLIS